ncbi:MAG: peptidylprolyl isomerase [Ignavibacteriaceae bacterium]
MLKQSSYLLLLSFAFLLVSCSPKQSEIVVAEYGGKEILMKEFEDAYAKSAGGYEIAEKDSLSRLKSFLDLYVNFKMKLRDAEVRGYDQDPALQAELLDYKKRVGTTYLIEKEIVEPGVRDLYEKRKWELRVSHLMIRPDSNGTEAAREFTQSLLDSIKAGASYEELTKKYSHDNFSRPLGGDIYYVTAGLLPAEFDDAMYNTPEGEVYPEVVQTKYGFHIIKVTKKQERTPQIRASHILVNFQNDEGAVDSAAARARVDSVAAMLKEGKNFAELAAEYSEDGSRQQGGDLGYFERRNMVKEFDEAAFLLNVGEYSDVIRTQYGYHIIMLTDKKAYPSYADEKENLKKMFRQARYQEVYDSFVDSLKIKYNFIVDSTALESIAAANDSVKIGGEYNLDNLQDKTVIAYNGKSISVQAFLDMLVDQPDFQNRLITDQLLKNAAAKVSSDISIEEEALNLEKNNPTFASLMEDYKNGIFIFKLQEDEIWNKLAIDSTKLYQHYLDTKDKYVWPDRVSFSEIYSRKDSLINHYYSLLESGENFDSLASMYTERAGLREKAGNYGLTDIKSSPLAEEAAKLNNPGEYSKPVKNGNGFSIIKLNSKEASRLKTFEEAKAEASGSFQELESKRLENTYVDGLKETYNPVIYYDTLEEAFPGASSGTVSMENSDKASK